MAEMELKCPILDLTEQQRSEYLYIPREATTEYLENFGYGSSKRLVDALYLSPDRSIVVGILMVNEARCRDHFGVFRGVDGVESMAQTLLLAEGYDHQFFKGNRPIFTAISDVVFLKPAVEEPPVVLNVIVERIGASERGFGGRAWVLRGTDILTQGVVRGDLLTEREYAVFTRRTQSLQDRNVPIFGFQNEAD